MGKIKIAKHCGIGDYAKSTGDAHSRLAENERPLEGDHLNQRAIRHRVGQSALSPPPFAQKDQSIVNTLVLSTSATPGLVGLVAPPS